MPTGPTEFIIVLLIAIIRVAIPVLLIVAVIYYYLRLKVIEKRLRSLEEKLSGASSE